MLMINASKISRRKRFWEFACWCERLAGMSTRVKGGLVSGFGLGLSIGLKMVQGPAFKVQGVGA